MGNEREMNRCFTNANVGRFFNISIHVMYNLVGTKEYHHQQLNGDEAQSSTSSSDLDPPHQHSKKRLSIRSSTGKQRRRSSVQSFLDSDGDGPLDRFVTKTTPSVDHEDEPEKTTVTARRGVAQKVRDKK